MVWACLAQSAIFKAPYNPIRQKNVRTRQRNSAPVQSLRQPMFHDIIFPTATAMKFLRKRIRFYRPDGTRGDSPGCGSVLIAWGEDNADIIRDCELEGKYVRLN